MTKQWHGGKGSKQRPSEGTLYQDNWEKIFGKKKPKVKSRKVTPKHGQSHVHKDKSKYDRKDFKVEMNEL